MTEPCVLVSVYVADPERGSEPGVGFNWLKLYLELGYRVIALIHQDRGGSLERTRRALSEPIAQERLRIVAVEPTVIQRLLNRLPGFYYAFYFLYQRSALAAARACLRRHGDIGFVHHVSLNGFREPGWLWRLDRPFIWGPIGGAQNAAAVFLTRQPAWVRAKETVRNAANSYTMRWSLRPKHARAKARIVFAANRDAFAWARLRRDGPVRMMLETAVDALGAPPESPRDPNLILWIGSDEPRKNPEFALIAFGVLARLMPGLRLMMAGIGERRERSLRRFCRRWRIPTRAVSFVQRLPRQELDRLYAGARLFWFSSYRDTSGNVVLEAMRNGCPVVAFNHQGVSAILEEVGTLVDVGRYRDMVLDWARASRRLLRDEAAWRDASARSCQRIHDRYRWEGTARVFSEEVRKADLVPHA